MHIGLNAHLLSFTPTYRGAGISRYQRNLIHRLWSMDRRNRYTLYVGDRDVPPDYLDGKNDHFQVRISRLPTVRPPVRLFWEQVIQPATLLRKGVDLIHGLGSVQPVLNPARSVVTVQDLSFLRYPQTFNRTNRLYLSWATRYSLLHADMVIAASQNTRDDIIRLIGVRPERVRVIYHGIEEHFRPLRQLDGIDRPVPAADERTLAEFRARNNLPERILLFIGTLEPRKNVDILVEAFAQLRRETGCPHTLVIGGGKGWLYDSIFARVKELGLEEYVRFPGYIPEADLPLWYNSADIFLYPSIYEGFGFPPLEAMACGTPVITSNTSSLPEVVGSAGLMCPPRDPNLIAAACARILGDPAEAARLRKSGLAQASKFNWAETARQTIDVYEGVYQGRIFAATETSK